MKDIKNYILESMEWEDLQSEVSLALKEFGSIRHGFKMANWKDIEDAMYKLGFDFDEEESKDGERYVFVGDYINNKYEIDIYPEDTVKGKIKIKNFNVFEV